MRSMRGNVLGDTNLYFIGSSETHNLTFIGIIAVHLLHRILYCEKRIANLSIEDRVVLQKPQRRASSPVTNGETAWGRTNSIPRWLLAGADHLSFPVTACRIQAYSHKHCSDFSQKPFRPTSIIRKSELGIAVIPKQKSLRLFQYSKVLRWQS